MGADTAMETNGQRTIWILILTSLGFFMSMMDSMIVTTASTAIRTDFHISMTTLQWAMNAYNITIAAVLLVGVTLGERFGRRQIYNWGILIFTVGSIGCALAGNIQALVGARIIEGVGASVMTPMSMAILTHALPANRRGKALGIWSGIGGLALIVGPSLGGLIVARLAWPWIFWINVPIGLVAVWLSRRYLPESTGVASRLPLLDTGLMMVSLAGIIWSLSALPGLKPIVIGMGSLALGGWLLYRQSRVAEPMIPLSYFRLQTFTAGNMATFLLYAAMYGVVFFLPQFLQAVGGANALVAGLELLPWTGTLVFVAPFAGKAVDRFGEKKIATLGLALQALGYALIGSLNNGHQAYWLMIIPLALAGSGLSMAGPALQKAVLGAVKPAAIGQASGIYNVFRLLGGAVGTAVAVIVFNWFGNTSNSAAFTSGFRAMMLVMALCSLLGIGWSLQFRISTDD
ncbi:major facilitator superfamily transporter permease [Lactiplantibacillus fabifermentans DSM 21115]|uniref:Major facilitator superfamily transporter permease n=2 Tax=Lactiplantibacillus fabifermentans TaxID=483011 RepID=A0A0R2NME2_9LACO|nr:major facilitator superfamily transporter permease [Lactiplantibacillus fabifermentans DSM 21115]